MPKDNAQELTKEQCRYLFLKNVAALVTYWEKEYRTPDVRGKLEGLAFSIMTAIDGGAMALPSYKLMPSPHESDKQFAIDNGYDYDPMDVDIAGGLHELIGQHFMGTAEKPDIYTFCDHLRDSTQGTIRLP